MKKTMHLPGKPGWLLCIVLLPCFATAEAFSGDPPDAHHPWAVHDVNRPQPPRVQPASRPGDPPSDAIVLFDGSQASLANWRHEKPKEERKRDWFVEDGALVCAPGAGYLLTREAFGDCQLHIEWSAPAAHGGSGQGRSNSGVFLMGIVEVQVLDNFNNPTYADGTAGAVYGVMPPAANALRAPGQWQSYDIIFRRPVVRHGQVLDPGSLTVLCNGVVLQDSTPLEGGGGWKKRQPLNRAFPDRASLKLQDHGNPVRFRNIWIRPLRPRALDGGFDGRLDPHATARKRAAIAAEIRLDAATKSGLPKALRLYESLVYAPDAPALETADALTVEFLNACAQAPQDELKSRKGDFLLLQRALKYLEDHQLLPGEPLPLPRVESVIEEQGWKKQ